MYRSAPIKDVWLYGTMGHGAVPETYPTNSGVVRYDGVWQVTGDALFLLLLVSSLLLLLEVSVVWSLVRCLSRTRFRVFVGSWL